MAREQTEGNNPSIEEIELEPQAWPDRTNPSTGAVDSELIVGCEGISFLTEAMASQGSAEGTNHSTVTVDHLGVMVRSEGNNPSTEAAAAVDSTPQEASGETYLRTGTENGEDPSPQTAGFRKSHFSSDFFLSYLQIIP